MTKYKLYTTCVSSTADKINKMIEEAKEISYNTLLRVVGKKELSQVFPMYDWSGRGLQLKSDYAVSFYKSRYNDKLAYYVDHSRTEYIFIKEK